MHLHSTTISLLIRWRSMVLRNWNFSKNNHSISCSIFQGSVAIIGKTKSYKPSQRTPKHHHGGGSKHTFGDNSHNWHGTNDIPAGVLHLRVSAAVLLCR